MLSKNYNALGKLETSNLCLQIKFLPKNEYVDQQPINSRQYLVTMSADEFSKHFESKECTVEEAFKFWGWSEQEIAEQKKADKKAVGVVWQADVKLEESIRATWDRVFSAVLPAASKLTQELNSDKASANIWSVNADKNLAFVNEVSAIRDSIEKIDRGAWSDKQKSTVEEFLQAKNPADKPKIARQALCNLLLLEHGFRGCGSTSGGAGVYLVRTPYSDKLDRFCKYGELDPKHGYFSIRWGDKLESGKIKSDNFF